MANRTYVSLKHASVNSGVAVQIMCTVVGVTFNKKNDKTPNAEYAQYPAAVQTVSRENTKYVLESSKLYKGDLTYSLLLDFINLENDEGLVLNVQHNEMWLTDSLGATTDIPVTIDSALTVRFSTIDSKDAKLPSVNIPLVEVLT